MEGGSYSDRQDLRSRSQRVVMQNAWPVARDRAFFPAIPSPSLLTNQALGRPGAHPLPNLANLALLEANMSNANSTSQAFAPLAVQDRQLHTYLKWPQNQAQRELVRTSEQAMVTTLIALIAQSDVGQSPIDVLLGLYLEIRYAIQVAVEPEERSLLRAHQRACFAALMAALDDNITAKTPGLDQQSDVQERVARLAMLYQILEGEAKLTLEPSQQAAIRASYNKITEALWEEIKSPLTAMTNAKWVASWTKIGYFDDRKTYFSRIRKAETLALIGFSHICQQLPNIDLDPQRNILSLALVIAQRGISHEYKLHFDKNQMRAATAPIESGTPAAAMWVDAQPTDTVGPVEIVDPAWTEIEQRILEGVDRHDFREAVQVFIAKHLSPEERLILQRRWFEEPPASYESIATELGTGWTANNASVRHYRALKKLQKHLRSLGIG
jgi:hypothetical protein